MNKMKLNYWIDVGLAITFFITFITGIIKWPSLYNVFKPLGLPLGGPSLLHDWAGLIMSLLVFIHLILHKQWIVSMTKNIFSKKKENKTE